MLAINTLNTTIHGPTPTLNYAHCPTIAHHGGLFHVAWMGGRENREGGREQGILMATSDDFRRWSAAACVFDPPADTCLFEPVLLVMAGRLSCIWAENHVNPDTAADDACLREGNLMFSRLSDAGWEAPRVIATTDGPEGHPTGCPTLSNAPLTFTLPGGGSRTLCPVHYLNHGAVHSRPRSLYTDDGGESWQHGAFVPAGQRKLMEGTVYPLPDGRLVMLMRNDCDFPIVWHAFSEDHGVTWSPAEPTGLRSWAKTSTLVGSSGSIIQLYNDDAPGLTGERMAHDNATNAMRPAGQAAPDWRALGPCEMRQNLSVAVAADGQTFVPAGRFDLASNGYGCSYPVGIEVDGTLYVVSSRRDSMHTRRPNMIRGHILELVEVPTRRLSAD